MQSSAVTQFSHGHRPPGDDVYTHVRDFLGQLEGDTVHRCSRSTVARYSCCIVARGSVTVPGAKEVSPALAGGRAASHNISEA
eukprot:1180672-Prorocentrum_minimum.AAC.4